jgi:hypothetical protein
LGGNAGQANYSAGKAGVVGLTLALAKEWGRMKVNVNCVAFGFIKTRLTESTADGDATVNIEGRDIKVGINPSLAKMFEQSIPLGRAGTPDEAADAVYLLCLPESNYISGQTLVLWWWHQYLIVQGGLFAPLLFFIIIQWVLNMNHSTSAWMNADLELYRDNVRRFVRTEIAAHENKWREQQYVDRNVWRKAGELGVLLADIPEEYGGSGGNYAHMAVLFEELAYAGDRAFGVSVHAIVAHYLLNQGTEAQKLKYLPLLASGEMVGAIAMTEPGAGSDLQGIRTTRCP